MTSLRLTIGLVVFALGVGTGLDRAAAADQPLIMNDRLVFPEGADIPRSLTEVERRFMRSHPLGAHRVITPPPVGPIRAVGEYEPMDGLLMAWESFTTTLNAMSVQATVHANAKVYMVVDSAAEQVSAASSMSAAGVNMSKVQFVVRTTDSVWIRDYGPRYVYQGDCRAIVDHTYNRPRPNDDAFSSHFATVKHHAFYEHQLIHGGGNYHLNGLGDSFCTRLIVNENPTLTELEIHDIWQDYQNVDTLLYDPFPMSVDATQHIDMWMQVISDDRVIISDWPNNVGSTQDIICDNAAVTMAGLGWTVYRTPARRLGGVHFTYTNMVMCNNRVMVPQYVNTNMLVHNPEAMNTITTALSGTGKTAVGIANCDPIANSAGVIHCIVMHVPAHLGGTSPTAYLKNLRGGESLTPGDQVNIEWISDDDVGVSNVDLLLSTNSGASYDTTIALATADDGEFLWTVPTLNITTARVKVVPRDGSGNTGSDESDSDFSILIPVIPGDMNCDGVVDVDDVPAMIMAQTDAGAYASAYPTCDILRGDMDSNASVDGDDLNGFIGAVIP